MFISEKATLPCLRTGCSISILVTKGHFALPQKGMQYLYSCYKRPLCLASERDAVSLFLLQKHKNDDYFLLSLTSKGMLKPLKPELTL